MKIRKLASAPKVWRLLGVAAVFSLGFGVTTAGNAESYSSYIDRVIERAQTDPTFAARVRQAGPETYPLVVLVAAGYDLKSKEYRRHVQMSTKGGRDD